MNSPFEARLSPGKYDSSEPCTMDAPSVATGPADSVGWGTAEVAEDSVDHWWRSGRSILHDPVGVKGLVDSPPEADS